MTRFIARRGGSRQAARPVPPRVGHFYVGIQEQKLYCLNETARQFIREGIPILAQDLERQPLLTLEGQPVTAHDLPLTRARREVAVQEVVFLQPRPDGLPQVLAWYASPMTDMDNVLVGVIGSLTVPNPEPDWEGLAGLAHDLRTPLQAMRNLIPVLQTTPLLGPAAEALERLRSATDRALALGQHLLEWCKAPTGNVLKATRTWQALAPLLEKLASEQAPAAQRKGIRLETDLHAAVGVEIHTDALRLGRLVGNLLANAIRYTAAGHVRLAVAWREAANSIATAPPESELVLTVEDTGAGLMSEDPESIFQPFQRGKSAQSDSDSGGSGLGLAIVDRLVGELELTLDVYSEHGHGSRFDVIIPPDAVKRAS
jgi:signal transduction histidine kinase